MIWSFWARFNKRRRRAGLNPVRLHFIRQYETVRKHKDRAPRCSTSDNFGGGEGSRTPVRNRISTDVYGCMPPVKFPSTTSDGREIILGSFISAGSPQSLGDPVARAYRRAGGPDFLSLIAVGTGDLRVSVAALRQPAKKYFLRLILNFSFL